MAAKGLLAFENHVDKAATSLTASSETTGLGVANLADLSIQRCWRCLATSGWVQADLGADKEIGVIAFAVPRSGVMMGALDTVRVQLDADGGVPGTGALYDSTALAGGVDPGFGYYLRWFATPLQARYCRVTIDVGVSGLAYFQVGRLWIAPYVQPGRTFAYDWSREWDEQPSVVKAPRSGMRFRNRGPRFRSLALAFNALSAADADALEDGDIIVGRSGQMLVSTHPDTPARRTLFGTPQASSPILHRAFPVFAKAYLVEEDL
jgi:hypothetical protein